MFDAVVGFLYQFGDASAFLVLCASGLAIIFGMMGVINLAHGEFIMAGAYMTVTVAKLGAPLPLATRCSRASSGFCSSALSSVTCTGARSIRSSPPGASVSSPRKAP